MELSLVSKSLLSLAGFIRAVRIESQKLLNRQSIDNEHAAEFLHDYVAKLPITFHSQIHDLAD